MRSLTPRLIAGTACLTAGLGLAAHAYAGTHPCPSLEARLQSVSFEQLTDPRVMRLALAPVVGPAAPAPASSVPAPGSAAEGYLGMYEHYLHLTGRSLIATSPEVDTLR